MIILFEPRNIIKKNNRIFPEKIGPVDPPGQRKFKKKKKIKKKK